MKFPFLQVEKVGLRSQMKFTGREMKIYIPKFFFDEELATAAGENIESMGIFWFSVKENENDSPVFYDLSMPIKFMFSYSEEESAKNYKLGPKIPPIDYRVFVLKPGDLFVYDMQHRINVDDIKLFIEKLIEGAKMPPYVSYENVMQVFLDALIATSIDTKLGVSSVSFEFLLSVLYRNKANMDEEFRMAYNGNNPYDYQMVRIVKVPQLTSTFAGLMGEDNVAQLASAIVRAREGKPEKESPLEKVIKKY